jgi:hypothetical protein
MNLQGNFPFKSLIKYNWSEVFMCSYTYKVTNPVSEIPTIYDHFHSRLTRILPEERISSKSTPTRIRTLSAKFKVLTLGAQPCDRKKLVGDECACQSQQWRANFWADNKRPVAELVGVIYFLPPWPLHGVAGQLYFILWWQNCCIYYTVQL